MRISWLSPDEIAAARAALTAAGATWDDHFHPAFAAPPAPTQATGPLDRDWASLTEHVARAERVSAVVRQDGLAVARARFGASRIAIEAATLAAAALEDDALDLAEIEALLACAIDPYLFYAPFLEQLATRGRAEPDRLVTTYAAFVAAYAAALAHAADGPARTGAAFDALADVYVATGYLDEAEALFVRRHGEDRGDAAVALSASRAFLSHGAVGHAVQWLGRAADRADVLGRADFARQLRAKQDAIRRRLS